MDTQQLIEAARIIRTLNENTQQQPNYWIPVIAAFGGAVIGAVASFISTRGVESYKRAQQAKAIRLAILAEIKAMLAICEVRQYLDSLRSAISYLERTPNTQYKFIVRSEDEWSRVYAANVGQLGLLASEEASLIVEFYQMMQACISDVRPGGLIAEGAGLEQFRELERIYGRALSLGEQIVSRI